MSRGTSCKLKLTHSLVDGPGHVKIFILISILQLNKYYEMDTPILVHIFMGIYVYSPMFRLKVPNWLACQCAICSYIDNNIWGPICYVDSLIRYLKNTRTLMHINFGIDIYYLNVCTNKDMLINIILRSLKM